MCKVDNPAEIYGALYRLVCSYLNNYVTNISLIMGEDSTYKDLYDLLNLEIKYFEMLHQQLSTITAETQTEKEKARIEGF